MAQAKELLRERLGGALLPPFAIAMLGLQRLAGDGMLRGASGDTFLRLFGVQPRVSQPEPGPDLCLATQQVLLAGAPSS